MIQYAERLLEPRIEKDPRVAQLDYAIGILRQVRDYIESGSDVIEDMIARDVIMNELRNLPPMKLNDVLASFEQEQPADSAGAETEAT